MQEHFFVYKQKWQFIFLCDCWMATTDLSFLCVAVLLTLFLRKIIRNHVCIKNDMLCEVELKSLDLLDYC